MSRVDLKVVLLGKEYGGKTSLVERFLNDRFLEIPYQNTIGAAFGAKQVRVGNRSIIMGIWDTAGGERYEAMSRIYYRGARGAIVCYDMTDSSSFERTRFWVDELRKNEEVVLVETELKDTKPRCNRVHVIQNCKIYLCGTKKDLTEGGSRRVDYHQVDDFVNEMNAKAFETSAKSGEQVSEIFNKIAEDFVKSSPNYNEDQRQLTGSVTLRPEKATKNFLCC